MTQQWSDDNDDDDDDGAGEVMKINGMEWNGYELNF